jgi:hypothetical protein
MIAPRRRREIIWSAATCRHSGVWTYVASYAGCQVRWTPEGRSLRIDLPGLRSLSADTSEGAVNVSSNLTVYLTQR